MLKVFYDTSSNSSDIKGEVITQRNTLKQFDMEPCMAIPEKHFILEKENNCEEEINSTPQHRTGNID